MKKFILVLMTMLTFTVGKATILNIVLDASNPSANGSTITVNCNVGDSVYFNKINATSAQLFMLNAASHGPQTAPISGNTAFLVIIAPWDMNGGWVVYDINNNNELIGGGTIVQATTTGIFELSKMNVSVYPNPTSDYINIDLDEPVKDVSLYDINGKLVLNESDTKQLNVSNLNRGTYTLMVNTAKNSAAKTVILQ